MFTITSSMSSQDGMASENACALQSRENIIFQKKKHY